MRSVLAAASLLLLSTPAFAAAWNVDVAQSSLTFSGAQAGTPFTGHIKRFTPTITFDPADPASGSIAVELDMASATIPDDSEQNDSLPTEDWFFVSKFARATFTSSAIKQVGRDTNTFTADGTLTIRDQSKPITLPFTFEQQPDGTAIASGEVILDRRDFGLGGKQWADDKWIAYPVTVSYRIHATKK